MELRDALARRRMVRSFTEEAVPPVLVDELLDRARRAPSAGNTQTTAFLVLEGRGETDRYWDVTLAPARRAGFRWPELLRAPVLVIVWCSPGSYVARYAERDKARTGLGRSVDAWNTPYWYVDGGMVIQNLLLGAVDAGLGACLFGLFEHEQPVREAFAVPDGWRPLGTVALGHPAPDDPGRSANRPRPALDQVVHRGRW